MAPPAARAPRLPVARGSLGRRVLAALRSGRPVDETDPALGHAGWDDDADAALTLWVLHELAYRGFDGVDDQHERGAELLRLRARLEDDLERRLREAWPGPPPGADLRADFLDWVADHDGPSVARQVQTRCTREQALQLLRLRSVYHLKEADPTTWTVPRLPIAPKAALVALQSDEYGAGHPGRLHAGLFARGLEACGLSSAYGEFVDEAPTEVLEQNNALSMFGLQRRLRGASVGHLAAFEATSCVPSRRMVQGLTRLDLPAAIVDYYREHVEADAVHEQVALREICVPLVEAEPAVEADVWFGAWACLHLEDRTAAVVLADWVDQDAAAQTLQDVPA